MHDCIIKNNIATLQHLNVHKQLYLTTYYIQQIHITKNKANSSLKFITRQGKIIRMCI